jgi:formyltetrahydrofolate deformylase
LSYVLTFSCPDRSGLVHAVSSWLVEQGCNILDSDQFGDPVSQRFFMRVHFSGEIDLHTLQRSFEPVGERLSMNWKISSDLTPTRVLIMVSKMDHCLVDLLYRTRLGELAIEVPLVVSNHADVADLVSAEGIDFLHLPVTKKTKVEQEAKILAQIKKRGIDLVVLARYMQILTADFCSAMPGQIINIHHSFLPSFKGARPYAQAHQQGVKLIGATAHYVTADLDEGPIIEQNTRRVDHRMSPDQLVAAGRDVERMTLASAVRFHAEDRVLINDNRTVVFS